MSDVAYLPTARQLVRINSTNGSPTIEDVVDRLEMELPRQLSQVVVDGDASGHWLSVSCLHGFEQYRWVLGLQFNRKPDVKGQRIDVTVRYVGSDYPAISDRLDDVMQAVRQGIEASYP